MIQYDRTSDRVKIAAYMFLDKYEKSNGGRSTGVLFNKYMVLLNREMKASKIGFPLPHCWYRWGDEVVRYGLPYLGWKHDELGTTEVYFTGSKPTFNSESKFFTMVSDFADDFIKSYSKQHGQEEVIEEVYNDAPYEFQNNYRILREALKISRKNIAMNNFHEYIGELYERAMDSFPPDFNPISEQKTEFEHVFRDMLSSHANSKALYDLTETFWFFFCYRLRLIPKCHENVNEGTLEIWRSILPTEDGRFELDIRNYAYLYCRNSDDPVIRMLLVKREEGLKELNEIFDQIGDLQ